MNTELGLVAFALTVGPLLGVAMFFLDSYRETQAEKRKQMIESGKITFIKEASAK